MAASIGASLAATALPRDVADPRSPRLHSADELKPLFASNSGSDRPESFDLAASLDRIERQAWRPFFAGQLHARPQPRPAHFASQAPEQFATSIFWAGLGLADSGQLAEFAQGELSAEESLAAPTAGDQPSQRPDDPPLHSADSLAATPSGVGGAASASGAGAAGDVGNAVAATPLPRFAPPSRSVGFFVPREALATPPTPAAELPAESDPNAAGPPGIASASGTLLSSPQAQGDIVAAADAPAGDSCALLPADFDRSASVDAGDLATWEAHFGNQQVPTSASGDADLDTTVTGLDFLLWQQHFGGSTLTHPAGELPRLCPIAARDDGDWGYSEQGSWQSVADPRGWQDDWRSAAAGTGGAVAEWTADLAPGQYELFATWPAEPGDASDAPFRLADGDTELAIVRVDQSVAPGDGEFLGQRWESLGVYDFVLGTPTVELSNAADGRVVADAIVFVPRDVAEPLAVSAQLLHDSGLSASDRLTNNPRVVGSVAGGSGGVTLSVGVNGGAAIPVTIGANGAFAFDPAFALDGSADGIYTQLFSAVAGTGAQASSELIFTLDTTPPAVLEFELDPAFDTPPLGDNATTEAVVTFFGTTEPGARVTNQLTGDVATAGQFGQFLFAGLPLAIGENELPMFAEDAAGNIRQGFAAVRRDFDEVIDIAEISGTVTRVEVPVALGGNPGGRRTLEFDVAANFDLTAGPSAVRDSFSVYLLDAASGATLIDRGVVGETLWAVDEGGPSTAPEVPYVASSGARVVIDVSSVAAENGLATLVFELINGDEDDGSTATISNLAVVRDEFAIAEFIVPAVRVPASPAGESSLDTLAHPTDDVEVLTDNLRFDPLLGAYSLDLRVRNNGAVTFAPDVAVTVEDLPVGAQLATVSGFNLAGQPYVNFASVLPATGLPAGSESPRLTISIAVDDPQAVPLTPVFQPHARLAVLEIYEAIRNTYDFQPYRGAMKGAQGVRETGRGNAWDISSLLVEEFRAAGIPAEYAFDRVQIPSDLAINWLGAANLAGALEILTAAGLQPAEVLVGGVPAVEFDHAWVVANVAFPGESPWWLDFDPSIKQYEWQTGIPTIAADVPFDIDNYLAQQSPIDAAEYYATQVSDYLGIHHPGASLADVPQFGEIVPRHADALPAGVLFTFDGNPLTAASIPVHETHRVLVEIRTTFFGTTTTYASRTFSLPDEGQDRITITWESGGVPFSVVPKIRLDGDLPVGGQALSSGTPVDLVIGIFNAGDLIVDTALTRKIVAGETAAVALDANQISDEMLFDLQNVVNEAGFARLNGEVIDSETETGALLSLLGAQYFSDSYADAEFLLGLTGGRRNYNDVSVAFLAGQGLSTDPQQMFITIPETGLIDVLWQTLLVSPDGDSAHDQARQQLVGVNSSDHERRVFERQLAAEGISTIRVLQAANEAAIPVFTIDASNRALLEPQLRVSAQARLQIAQELNLGYTVTVPERSVTIGDWIGTGWITDGPLDDGFKLLGNFGAGNGGAWFSRVSPLEEFCFHPQPATLGQGRLGNRHYVDVVGNLFRSATDIALPAIGMPLEFERFYASSAQADVGLGVGWNHTWGHRLEFAGDGSVVWVTPHQHGFRFLPDGSGGFVTPDLLAGTLTELPDGSFSYRHKDGLTRLFDSSGQFQEVHDRFGNRVTLSYDAGRLASVDHQTSGVSLQFSYVDDHISSVTDYAGRTWHYDYDQLTHPFFGTDYFALAQVTSPSDAVTAAVVTGYSYYNDLGRAGLLAEIIDPDGLAETFQYAANGKILSTSHPETGTLTFEYDFAGKTTTATDARGFRWRTYYDDEGQIIREDRENDFQQMIRVATHSWVAGNLTSTTDALGHTTTFTYDALDNVVQTIDALGNITSTTYDPQFSLPLIITEPGGRVTSFAYDTAGNEISSLDPEGNLTTASYDAHGQRLTLTFPRGAETGNLLGFTTTYVYNPLGLITSFTTGLPRSETFAYDAAGNLVRGTDGNGDSYEYTYDRLDRLIAKVDPLGNQERTLWDVLSRPIVEIDAAGRRTATAYDRLARTEVVILADHSAVRKSYDPLGNVTELRNERGFTTRYEFDSRARLVAVVFPDGARETQAYDDADRLISRRDARGNEETFVYDALHRVIGQIDPLGGVRTNVLDAYGNLLESIDELGRSYSFEYDDLDRLIAMHDPLGGIHLFTFDAHGNLTSSTDVLGRVRTMTYDVDDRLIAEVDPVGGQHLMTYDAVGNLLAETDQLGRITHYEYDPLNRAILSVDPLGNIARVTYDAVGNPIATEDRLGRVSEFAYDALNRVVLAIDPVGGFEEWAYDQSGNLSTFRDKRGFFSTFEYDARNRLVRSFNPLGGMLETTYDADGNVSEVVDQLGRITTYEYDALNRSIAVIDDTGGVRGTQFDAVGNVVETTDELGRSSIFAYDALNRLIAETDPVGGVRRTNYDLAGNATSIVDQNGRTTQFAYDSLNRLIERINAIGGAAQFAYDAVGNLTGAVDELGRTAQFTYDANDRLQNHTDAAGGVRVFQYDAVGNTIASVDQLGRTTEYAYDGLNRLVRTTNAIGGQQFFAYDQMSNLAGVTDELGRTTTYLYDGLGRLIVTTDPLGQSSSRGWDAVGNLVAATDQLGRLTQFQYDNLNRHVRTIDPLGGTVDQTWDAAQNLIASTDQLGRTSGFAFDALNRLVAATDPLGRLTLYEHDGVGNLTGITDPLGRYTELAYDGLDRLVAVTDALGGVRSYAFDAVGNLETQTDEIGRTTSRLFDSLDRMVSQADPLGNQTLWAYDAVGNVRQTVDPRGQATEYEYDDLNRLVSVADPLGGRTQYAYDLVSNIVEIIDPVGNATTYAYDPLDRPVGSTNALGDSRSFAYDAVGNLRETTDRNGRAIRYAYDALDRRTLEQWLDGAGAAVRSLAYSFDATGQLTSAQDPEGIYNYLYDAAGRMTQMVQGSHPGVPEITFGYEWDDANNLLTRTESMAGLATALTAWTYDALNRTTRITQSGSDSTPKRVDLAWDAASQPLSIERHANLAATGQALQTAYTYDAAGRLVALDHTQGPVELAAYSWTFDAADRLVQATTPDGAVDYAYDDRDQLIAANHASQADESYTYDANGNRTLAGYQTGSDNRVVSDGTYDYQYDAEGNRTLRTEIATGVKTSYEWDHRNRLTEVRTTDSVGNLLREAVFEYDLFDNRIARSIDSDGDGPLAAVTERLVYEQNHIALVFDESGQRTDRYLHGPQIDQIFAAEDAGGDLLWALTDHLGTVRDVADASGVIANHIVYDSFGRVVNETDPSVDFRFSYTGREFDQETDLFYYRARYYDAALGRFVSQDPISFAAGDANLYRYVGNHPVYATDPLGLAEGPDEEKPEELEAKALLGAWISKSAQFIQDHVYLGAFNGPDSTLNPLSSSSPQSFTPTVGPFGGASSSAGSQAGGGGGAGAGGGGGIRPEYSLGGVAQRPFDNPIDQVENATDQQFDEEVRKRLASKRPTAELEAGGMVIARAQGIVGKTVREQLNQAARDRNYVDRQIGKVIDAASKNSSLLKTRIGETLQQLQQSRGSGRHSELAKALANTLLGTLEGSLAKAGSGLSKGPQRRTVDSVDVDSKPATPSTRSTLVEVGDPPSSVGKQAPIGRTGSKQEIFGPQRPAPPPRADGSREPVVPPTPVLEEPVTPPRGNGTRLPSSSGNPLGGDTVQVGAGGSPLGGGVAPLGRPHVTGGPSPKPIPPDPQVTMITATPQPRLTLQTINGREFVRVESWDGKYLYTADRQVFELLEQKVPSPRSLPAERPRIKLPGED
jgi:RHS repeat-associated protein